MNRLSFLILSFIIYCLILIACSSGNIETPTISKKAEKVTIYEMESFYEVKEEPAINLINSEEIKIFQEAFGRAVKQPGIVDMADPPYKVDFGEEVYFLWINQDSGTIMNTMDTHTIYYLLEKPAKQVHELIIVNSLD